LTIRRALLGCVLSLLPAVAGAAPLDAAAIMQSVARNQDREQAERARWVYDQHVRVILRRTNGKLTREESADYAVTPSAKGNKAEQRSIQGRYWKNGSYHEFKGDPVPEAESLDGQLTHDFRDDLTHGDSKDGLAQHLFPLTTDNQRDLTFEMAGEVVVEGRPAYRIRFRPSDSHELTWAGEATIDKEELEPVYVWTRLSRRIPFVIRTMLGTDLPGVGFSVRYKRVAPDVWFPVSFGSEFRIHAVFFINRMVSLWLENKDFKEASADSTIHYDAP
jgi:hypothetical protein